MSQLDATVCNSAQPKGARLTKDIQWGMYSGLSNIIHTVCVGSCQHHLITLRVSEGVCLVVCRKCSHEVMGVCLPKVLVFQTVLWVLLCHCPNHKCVHFNIQPLFELV